MPWITQLTRLRVHPVRVGCYIPMTSLRKSAEWVQRSETHHNDGGFRYRSTHPDMGGPVKCVRSEFCFDDGVVGGGDGRRCDGGSV